MVTPDLVESYLNTISSIDKVWDILRTRECFVSEPRISDFGSFVIGIRSQDLTSDIYYNISISEARKNRVAQKKNSMENFIFRCECKSMKYTKKSKICKHIAAVLLKYFVKS